MVDGKTALLEGVYLKQKPFYYKTKDGLTDGMILRIFQAATFCLVHNATVTLDSYKYNSTVKFKYPVDSKLKLIEYIKNDINKNVSKPRIYLPVLSEYNPFDAPYKQSKKMKSAELFRAEVIAVILHNNKVYLGSKIIQGLLNSSQIFLFVLVMLIFAASFLWIFEQNDNDKIDKLFTNGFPQSIWWTMVTLSTVGYGDVVPNSFTGRVIGVIWMSFAVMLTSVLTSMLTGSVMGIKNLKIKNKFAASFPNSIITHCAKQNYRAKVIHKNSTKDILEAVHNEEVYAGLLDTYYATWHQDEFEKSYSVSVVYIIKKTIIFDFVASSNKEVEEFFECIEHHKNEFLENPIINFKRKCKTTILKYEGLRTILLEGIFGPIMLSLALFLLVFVLVYQGVTSIFIKKQKQNENIDLTEKREKDKESQDKIFKSNGNNSHDLIPLKEHIAHVRKQIELLRFNKILENCVLKKLRPLYDRLPVSF